MIIKPMVRNNICLNSHPAGCFAVVRRQIGLARQEIAGGRGPGKARREAPAGSPRRGLISILACSRRLPFCLAVPAGGPVRQFRLAVPDCSPGRQSRLAVLPRSPRWRSPIAFLPRSPRLRSWLAVSARSPG